ncbi:response regulator [Rariglobus hedericola]|uniref:Response regulator transcription factor n=1 Tax=Rariglobus hedericola TaxID=2597822 RepID=A0A556QSA5_9BACT|nr:response regulator transcription factor [Rariglobus hedericola]TSJ79520.1 response regulator transcription factor [Rariglobus hedericola]
MKSLITILLADDHVIVRQGLCGLLKADDSFKILAEARNGREAVQMAAALNPDVIVMDIAMPILNGLEATRQILAANPAAKVIILSAHSDEAYIERMSTAGVVGFLEKQTSAEIFTKAIKEVAKGRTFFSPSITRRMAITANALRDRDGLLKTNPSRLTSRECEVLQLVAEGAANKQIAATLGISIKTVEKHRQNLMEKLGIHHTAGLTRYAISTGVIESSVQLTII